MNSFLDAQVIMEFSDDLRYGYGSQGAPYREFSIRAKGILEPLANYIILTLGKGTADPLMVHEFARAIANGDYEADQAEADIRRMQEERTARWHLWLSRECPYCGAAKGMGCRTHKGKLLWYSHVHSGRKRRPSDYREPGAVWRDEP